MFAWLPWALLAGREELAGRAGVGGEGALGDAGGEGRRGVVGGAESGLVGVSLALPLSGIGFWGVLVDVMSPYILLESLFGILQV